MSARREGSSKLGARSLVGLLACGALSGYALPALASSLIRQERRAPEVRLLPGPRVPRFEPPAAEPEHTESPQVLYEGRPPKRPRALTRAQLERKNPPPPARILSGPVVVHRGGEVAPPAGRRGVAPVTVERRKEGRSPKPNVKTEGTGGTPVGGSGKPASPGGQEAK